MTSSKIAYYRNLLSTEKERLNGLCTKWREFSANDKSVPEDVQGQIRTTVGQAELLMNQRFAQFSGLIDNSEFNLGEKETTCEDLAGFWDMIYFQVEDVDNKFEELSEAEKNNWILKEKPAPQPKQYTRALKPANVTSKPNIKKSLEARKRLAIAKAQKIVNESSEKENQKTFEVPGFFVVNSPLKKKESPRESTPSRTPKKTPVTNSARTPKNCLLIAQVTRSARKALATTLQYDM